MTDRLAQLVSLFEEEPSERLDDLLRRLREIDQRFQDRLTGRNILGFVEGYIHGNFGIVVQLEGRGEAKGQGWAVSIESAVGKIDDRSILTSRYKLSELGDGQAGNQEPVLVDVVELADGPQQKVPVFVRAYVVNDEILSSGKLLHHWSLRDLVHKLSPTFVARKMLAAFEVGRYDANDPIPKVVEGNAEVVDGLSHHDRQMPGQSAMLGADAQAIVTGIGVTIWERGVLVRMDDPLYYLFDVSDVIVGPLDAPVGHMEGVRELIVHRHG